MPRKQNPLNKNIGSTNLSKRGLNTLSRHLPKPEIIIPIIDGIPGAGKTRYAINELIISQYNSTKPVLYLAETHRLVEEVMTNYFMSPPLKAFHKKGFSLNCTAYKIIQNKVKNNEDLTNAQLAFFKMVEINVSPKRLCKMCKYYDFRNILPYDKCNVRSERVKESKSDVILSVRHFLGTKELKKKVKTKGGVFEHNKYKTVIADDLNWTGVIKLGDRKTIDLEWKTLKSFAQSYYHFPQGKWSDSLFHESDETFEEWCKAIQKFQNRTFNFKLENDLLLDEIYFNPKDFRLVSSIRLSKYAYWRVFDDLYHSNYCDYPIIFHLFNLAKEGVNVIFVGSQQELLKKQLYQLAQRYYKETGIWINFDYKKYLIPKRTRPKKPNYVKIHRLVSRGHFRKYWKVSLIEPSNKTKSYDKRVINIKKMREYIKKTIIIFLDYLSGELGIPIEELEIGLIVYKKLADEGKQELRNSFLPLNFPVKNMRVLYYNNLLGSNDFVDPYPVNAMIQIGTYVENPRAALRRFKGLYPHIKINDKIEPKKNKWGEEYQYNHRELDEFIAYINQYERIQAILRSRMQMPVLVFGDVPEFIQKVWKPENLEINKIDDLTIHFFYGLQEWEIILLEEIKKRFLRNIPIYSCNSKNTNAYSILKEINRVRLPKPRNFYDWCQQSTAFNITEVYTSYTTKKVRVLVPRKNL